MSNREQLEDNIRTMRDIHAFEKAETEALKKVSSILEAIPQVPCTRCGYCLDRCPVELPIPNLIGVLNNSRLFGRELSQNSFNWYARRHKPSECLKCKACEKNCPQHLTISRLMEELKNTFE